MKTIVFFYISRINSKFNTILYNFIIFSASQKTNFVQKTRKHQLFHFRKCLQNRVSNFLTSKSYLIKHCVCLLLKYSIYMATDKQFQSLSYLFRWFWIIINLCFSETVPYNLSHTWLSFNISGFFYFCFSFNM